MTRDRSEREVNSDAATQESGNRVVECVKLDPPPKDSDRLVWNSGDPTAWNNQVIMIVTIDSTPQVLA